MKTRWGAALPALAFLLLLGVGPCEREMPDSIEPMDHYYGTMDGKGAVAINHAVSYFVGPMIDPASISAATVYLQLASDGSVVPGLVKFYDTDKCAASIFDCPRGVGIQPYDAGGVCDLEGDTLYELVLDGLVLADGTPLPLTVIPVRTRPAPDGYTPTYCVSGPSLWMIDGLDATEGMSGAAGIAGDAPWVIIATGVLTFSPYEGYDNPYEGTIQLGNWNYAFAFVANSLAAPPYIPLLVVQNGSTSDYDLSLLADADRMIRFKDDAGNPLDVKLPAITIPGDEALFLYADTDGSSYYAYDDSGTHTYDRFDPYPSYLLTPPDALANPPAASW